MYAWEMINHAYLSLIRKINKKKIKYICIYALIVKSDVPALKIQFKEILMACQKIINEQCVLRNLWR